MNRDHGGRPFRDQRLHFRGVHLESFPVGVYEHGQGILQQYGVDSRDKGIGRHEHLVARANPQGVERGNQRAGAICHCKTEPGPDSLRIFGLEPLNIVPI